MKAAIVRLFASELELRARIFNLLGVLGTAAGILLAVSSLATGAGTINIVLNLASSALALGLMIYANTTSRFVLCYRITVVVVFLLFFPVMFFAAGGYRSGMPSFFVFAVLFTIFMLEGRERIPMALLETALYVVICLIALYYPQMVYLFETEADAAFDVIIGFTVSSALLGFAMILTFRMYDDTRRKLGEKNAALERIDRLKTEFMGDVAHELKTPLTVISGYAQESGRNAANLPESADIRRNMRLISSEADRLAMMVSQVLDAARIDEERLRFNLRPHSLSQIIQNTLQTYYPVFSKNGNTLELERGGDSPAVICDDDRVTQVLVNLIANASRHTYNGKITISARNVGEYAEVAVTDTGSGISPQRLEEVFERFKTASGGTGLGLYISRYIVEGQGGRIWLTSEEGQGTVVRFTIPLQSGPSGRDSVCRT